MPPAPRSHLDGTDRLVIDGTNLLYRLGQGRAEPPAPPAAIIGRLRAAIPATVAIDLVFDGIGHGVSGRVAQQLFVRYSGRRSGDDTILDLAAGAAQLAGGDAAGSARVLVVTDDRELRARLQARGVRTAPLHWLTAKLDVPFLASSAAGNRRPPIGFGRSTRTAAGAVEGAGSGQHGGSTGSSPSGDDDRAGWKPGRGATAKTGPAHKIARHKRHPKNP